MSRTSRAARTGRTGRLLRMLAAITLTTWMLTVGMAGTASANTERIGSYDVQFAIEADGTIQVTETIRYDFGATERHGIEREIPIREPVGDGQARVYRVEDVEVSSPTAPDQLSERDNGRDLTLRIGDPDRTITGTHEYTIEYRLAGALNAQQELDELYWDAIGDGWSVGIESASVEVTAPGGIERVACYSGRYGGDDPCTSGEVVGPETARFTQSAMEPRQPLTIVVGLAKGTVTVPEAEIVDQNNRLGGPIGEIAATLGPIPYTIAGLIAVGSITLAGRSYWRTGRDQLHAGTPYGLAPTPGAGQTGHTTLITPWKRPEVPVEFRPPPDIPPGLAGTLIDEVADTHDVTATIIDLAVRGHLRIEEVSAERFWESRDWTLYRLEGPDGDTLTEMERHLLRDLFESGDEVKLSDLKEEFNEHLAHLKVSLYREVVSRGWFTRRPDKVRTMWTGLGGVVGLAGIGGLGWSLKDAQYGLAAITAGVLVGGIALLVVARAMPARTPDGTAAAARVQGFRRYLATAEADQLRFEEREDIFSRYLPYAIVFGLAERWAKVFDELASTRRIDNHDPSWYRGSSTGSYAHLGASMAGFSTTAGSVMSASKSSSSASGGSGFSGGSSGGGGGGGGGGSW